MNKRKNTFVKITLAFCAFAVCFFVYYLTLSRTISAGDSTEMVAAAISLGIPHQPGYPLNTLLGNLGANFPLNVSPVIKVNAVSALIQSLTVFVFYFLMNSFLEYLNSDSKYADDTGNNNVLGQYLISFTTSLFLGFSLVFWQYSEKFEVFPLNNLFSVTLLLIAFQFLKLFKNEKGKRIFSTRGNLLLIFLALIFGLAITHHQTVVLVIPSILILVFKKAYDNIEILKKKLIYIIPSFFIGFSIYFLLFWLYGRKNPYMNWGNVKSVFDALPAFARSDYGTFSAYLRGAEVTTKTYPIDQFIFYLKNINTSFTFFGVIFAILGFWYLYKKSKMLFYFVFSGVFIAGVIFTSFAGFPISDAFNQATLLRFYMLPDIFMSLAIGAGLWYLYNMFSQAKTSNKEQKLGAILLRTYLILSFAFLIFVNFPKADLKGINLTKKYAFDAFATTPTNSLILVSGDVPNMASEYLNVVEGKSEGRLIFTPGQFHLDWFKKQLSERYPKLSVPEPKQGKLYTSTSQVVDANYEKAPIFVSPELSQYDPELAEKYVLYPRHLLFEVKKKGDDIKLEDYKSENEALFNSLDLDQIKKIQKNTPMFEETVIFYYVRHFYNVGHMYEEVGLFDDAITEHKRVLKIDPYFKDSLAALGRIYGYKLENPDYATAIDYYQKYQSVLKKEDSELGYEAKLLIDELRGKMVNEQNKGEADAKVETATKSAEPKK